MGREGRTRAFPRRARYGRWILLGSEAYERALTDRGRTLVGAPSPGGVARERHTVPWASSNTVPRFLLLFLPRRGVRRVSKAKGGGGGEGGWRGVWRGVWEQGVSDLASCLHVFRVARDQALPKLPSRRPGGRVDVCRTAVSCLFMLSRQGTGLETVTFVQTMERGTKAGTQLRRRRRCFQGDQDREAGVERTTKAPRGNGRGAYSREA